MGSTCGMRTARRIIMLMALALYWCASGTAKVLLQADTMDEWYDEDAPCQVLAPLKCGFLYAEADSVLFSKGVLQSSDAFDGTCSSECLTFLEDDERCRRDPKLRSKLVNVCRGFECSRAVQERCGKADDSEMLDFQKACSPSCGTTLNGPLCAAVEDYMPEFLTLKQNLGPNGQQCSHLACHRALAERCPGYDPQSRRLPQSALCRAECLAVAGSDDCLAADVMLVDAYSSRTMISWQEVALNWANRSSTSDLCSEYAPMTAVEQGLVEEPELGDDNNGNNANDATNEDSQRLPSSDNDPSAADSQKDVPQRPQQSADTQVEQPQADQYPDEGSTTVESRLGALESDNESDRGGESTAESTKGVTPILDGPWARLPEDFEKVRSGQNGNDTVNAGNHQSQESELVEPHASAGASSIAGLKRKHVSSEIHIDNYRLQVILWLVAGCVLCAIGICLCTAIAAQRKQQVVERGTAEGGKPEPGTPSVTAISELPAGTIFFQANNCRQCVKQETAPRSAAPSRPFKSETNEQWTRQGAFLVDTSY